MNNDKIGKAGEYSPTLTVCGNAAIKPYAITIGLGGGFYCVKDVFPCPEWAEEKDKLRALVSKNQKVSTPKTKPLHPTMKATD